ncbi:MAG: cysteine desulfurase family protein [Dongiaceae bacterium]
MSAVYLDYNATSPLRLEVKRAMAEALDNYGNPSSIHQAGRAARKKIEEARVAVATSVGVAPHRVIFTSNGSEANNTILRCVKSVQTILISAIEHDSVRRAVPDAVIIPVDQQGLIKLEALENLLQAAQAPALVSVMLANNETGAIQPIAEVVEIAKRFGAYVHTDAVQAFGKMPVNFIELGVDAMTIAAHKVGGPKGVGALIVNERIPLSPFLLGGGQERNLRAGTENVPAIIGFGALAQCLKAQENEWNRQQNLRDYTEEQILVLSPNATILAKGAPRLPNTSCLALPAWRSETLLLQFDLSGIAVSSGAACSSGKVKPSHVLQAMNISEDIVQSALRVSIGWKTVKADIDAFLNRVKSLHEDKTLAA